MKNAYSEAIMLCFVQGFEGTAPNQNNCDLEKLEFTKSETVKSHVLKKRVISKSFRLNRRDGIKDTEKSALVADAKLEVSKMEIFSGKLKISNSSDKLVKQDRPEVKRSFSDRFSFVNDPSRKTNGIAVVRKNRTSSKRKSGEVGAVGAAAGGGGGMAGGAPRSAPSTPLQLDSLPPASARLAAHAAAKHDKSGIKQLSSSAPSVHATPVKTPRTPSKARQKKFLRHFPQVSPDERVLNYYACALVGDILLQGHLYITKNYFAFYSNVFGYVTKLLIPTSSVLRVSKEKMARIIPNAVGVATDDERHVFGSLLSRDSTYKLMVQVWKAAVTAEELVVETPAKELRGSEIELDASEYSPEEESSCSGSGTEAPSAVRRRTPASRSRPDGEPLPISVTKPPPVIQPALLLSNTPSSAAAAASAAGKRGEGSGTPIFATAAIFAVLLALSAALMLYRLQAVREAGHVRYYKEHFHERQDENVLLWQSQLHGQAAGELQQFLNTNLHLLSKVRQSLEALSTLILTDATRQNQLDGSEERRTDADERGAES